LTQIVPSTLSFNGLDELAAVGLGAERDGIPRLPTLGEAVTREAPLALRVSLTTLRIPVPVQC
jgi:hypothetical protein